VNYQFVSTKPGAYQEDRKAEIKNYNLPILQYMYMGNCDTPLECLITKTPGFIAVNDFVTGRQKTRFRLDFNHIRQRASENRHAGHSVDKGSRVPSGIFRETRFDNDLRYLFEFMTIMPISTEYHSYISQDSAKGNITLTNFKKEYWPWVLQSKKNYNDFCGDYNLNGVKYEEFIDHLSHIHYPSINDRLRYDYHTRTFTLV